VYLHYLSLHVLFVAYLLTPWSRVLEKVTGFQPAKKFPTFYGTWRFINAFTTARHTALSWATSTQSMTSHHTSWRFILIFPHQNPIYTPPLPHTCYMPRQSNFSPLDQLNNNGWWVQTLRSSLSSFFHSPVSSSLLGPNNLINTIFSNTISLCSSLNASDQVSHQYTTLGKIIVLYISIFNFWIPNWETKDFAP